MSDREDLEAARSRQKQERRTVALAHKQAVRDAKARVVAERAQRRKTRPRSRRARLMAMVRGTVGRQ
jgi:hypothetical protein